ncbi:hypothetical protein ACVJF1_006981 [Bradyrhizobium diazoefficiens]
MNEKGIISTPMSQPDITEGDIDLVAQVCCEAAGSASEPISKSSRSAYATMLARDMPSRSPAARLACTCACGLPA